jgi:hypothetical protein
MKFKAEVSLLVFAIALFAVSMFFYTYQTSFDYPYRTLALAFVGVGSISTAWASISYQRKSKLIE